MSGRLLVGDGGGVGELGGADAASVGAGDTVALGVGALAIGSLEVGGGALGTAEVGAGVTLADAHASEARSGATNGRRRGISR